MEEKELNKGQRLVLEAIQDEALTYEDIADYTELSYDGVRGRVSELMSMGYNIDKMRENGRTYIIYKQPLEYRRPSDIKESVTHKIRAIDDFYGITDFLQELKKTKIDEIPFTGYPTEEDKHAVLLLSDLHFGELIYSPGNELIYNTKIAEKRMENLTISVIEKLQDENINHLHILGLGDMVDGDMIYRNHLFRIEKPASAQILDAVKSITKTIKQFVANGLTVEMHNVRGNHGITNYNNLEEDNWDSVVYDMLELVFNENTEVSINNFKSSQGIIDVGEIQIVLAHGERFSAQIKTASGLREFRGMCGKYKLNDGDMIVVGHLHEFGIETDQGKLLIRNGSVANASEYAFKLNLYSEPMQTLMIIKDDELYPTIYPINMGVNNG